MMDKPQNDDRQLISEAYKRHSANPDWYAAQLASAIPFSTNIKEAIELADLMFKAEPNPPRISERDERNARRDLANKISEVMEKVDLEIAMSTDAQGLEHKGKGKGGGQFVSKGKGSESSGETGKSKKTKEKEPEAKETEDTEEVLEKQREMVPFDPSKPIDERLYTPTYASEEEHKKALELAISKSKVVPMPTPEEVAAAEEGVARLGANKFRRNLTGNVNDRAKRRAKLLEEFSSDGLCVCIYCGILIGDNLQGSLEQDKIITTIKGGRYRLPNIVPSCTDCNKKRSDMSFDEAIEKVVEYGRTPSWGK